MGSGSRARRSPRVNTPVDAAGELDELAGAQGPAMRSNVRSDEAPTEAPTPPEASTPPLVPPTSKDLFTKFMKVFMETTQAQAQALAEPQERPLKARTSETYSRKSHMDCYHFCQQYEDYFETSGATGMNRTPFAATFLRDAISLRWTYHKRRHECATPITWSEFKAFFRKDFGVPRPLLTVSGVSLGGTPNTSWKKLKTEYPIFNPSSPSYESLIRSGPPTN